MVMTRNINNKLTRIAVFYDGNYFAHVSNYYNYEHERKERLSISGLHEFIRNRVAEEEQVDSRFCQIVDAHYFRERIGAMQWSADHCMGRDLLRGWKSCAALHILHYQKMKQKDYKSIGIEFL